MKKFLIFIGGFVAGIIATILVAFLIRGANEPNDDWIGLTMFPEKGECIEMDEIVVFQVLELDMALARSNNRVVVLLTNYEGKTYYDNQKIKIPSNECARQIGTYKYDTDRSEKTVPVVVIEP